MEDARIVELYWERDEAAIAESSAKYGGYCYQIAFRILALREDAEECVGDTWLRAWEAMPPSRPGRLDTFLGKITRNLSLDRWRALRAQKRWQGQAELALTELGDCLPASGGVEQEVEAAALAESLNRFLESLPQEKRVLCGRAGQHRRTDIPRGREDRSLGESMIRHPTTPAALQPNPMHMAYKNLYIIFSSQLQHFVR